MKLLVSTILAGMLVVAAGDSAAAITPIHRNGLDATYAAALADALDQAEAACSILGGTIVSHEVVSSEQLSGRVWHVSILALCET